MAVVLRLLLFQKYYIEREVWRERVVGSARAHGRRISHFANKMNIKMLYGRLADSLIFEPISSLLQRPYIDLIYTFCKPYIDFI